MITVGSENAREAVGQASATLASRRRAARGPAQSNHALQSPKKLDAAQQKQLEHFTTVGTGTTGGEPGPHKAEELEYWRNFAINNGITDTQVIGSAGRFKQALDKLERRLESTSYLLGNNVSLADIS